MKHLREIARVSFLQFLNALDDNSISKIRRRKDIIAYILKYGRNPAVSEWLKKAVALKWIACQGQKYDRKAIQG
ncbi:MAG: hypothetical protein ACI32N_00490, partial [Bulleidia sp.]